MEPWRLVSKYLIQQGSRRAFSAMVFLLLPLRVLVSYPAAESHSPFLLLTLPLPCWQLCKPGRAGIQETWKSNTSSSIQSTSSIPNIMMAGIICFLGYYLTEMTFKCGHGVFCIAVTQMGRREHNDVILIMTLNYCLIAVKKGGSRRREYYLPDI